MRQRRSPRRSQLDAEVALLEERSLLSSSVLGVETLVNTPNDGNQALSPCRSIGVTEAGVIFSTWSSTNTNGNGANVFARLTAADGSFTGAQFQVSNTLQGRFASNAVVGVNGNNGFVVVWQTANAQGGATEVWARRFDASGSAQGGQFQIGAATNNAQRPSVALVSNTQFVVAWSANPVGPSQSTIYAQLWDLVGNSNPVSPVITVPSTNAGTKQEPVVLSLPGGGFQVAWSGNGGGDSNGVFSRRFNANGSPNGGEFRVNTANGATESNPTMARNGNSQIVILWQATGNPLDTDGSGVIARNFDLSGNAQGGEYLINETTKGNQDSPSIAFMTGGFIVAWRDAQTAPATISIYQREFIGGTQTATPRFGQRLVNGTVDGNHANPAVRALSNGYVIAWDGKVAIDPTLRDKTFDNQGIALQRYGDPFMPKNTKNSASEVMYSDPSVPLKTITLTNNTDQTVYPILRAANSNQNEKRNNPVDGKPWSLYDPYDDLNKEFRGYVGYLDSKTNQYYLGLLPGQTLTVQVPLVYWDAGRVYLATDGSDMIPLVDNLPALAERPNSPNPFHYHDKNQDDLSPTLRYRVQAVGAEGDTLTGYIMWYKARSLAPDGEKVGLAEDVAHDSPTQLTEYTFRSDFLKTLPTADDISKDEKHTLVNYDVSYVDSMLLPVAMEAMDVPIYGEKGGDKMPFGWIGSKLTVKEMQDAIKNFTSTGSGNGLGNYFGDEGEGFPAFYFPSTTVSGIKVPSGQNIIDLSPNLDKRSSFSQNLFMLTSSPGPIEAAISAHPNGTKKIRLEPADATPAKLAVLQYALDHKVEMDLFCSDKDIIPTGTTLVSLGSDASGPYVMVNQDVGTEKTPSGHTIRFVRKSNDYAETRLTDVWYSWADYYVDHTTSFGDQKYKGKIDDKKNVLTFDSPVAASTLVAGMQVTGPGLPKSPDNEKTVILKVLLDKNDNTKAVGVELSKLVDGNQAAGTEYSFIKPQLITRSSEVAAKNPFTFTFGSADEARALAFAKQAYLVMQSFSTVLRDPKLGTFSQQLMANVIGCNIGKVEHIGNLNPKSNFGNAAIPNAIRDATKSVMRGVPDFTDSKNYPETSWYPDPSLNPVGGQDFNVWNVNPFVWFVHKKLGMSGYGFSVDDDVADVGAEYATKLHIAIGGLDKLLNKAEWSWGAPYGPVSSDGTIVKITDGGINDGMYKIIGLNPSVVARINLTDPVTGLGAKVEGQGIVMNPGEEITVVKNKLGATEVLLSRAATPGGKTLFTFSEPKPVIYPT